MKTLHNTTIRDLSGPVLLTGHTGFKGAWLSLILAKMGIPVVGLSLPPDENSLYLKLNPLKFEAEIFQDIRDSKAVESLIKNYEPSAIFHLAAQPLVMESYKTPRETFETNVMGTANLLNSFFKSDSASLFVGVTTDKVYKNVNAGNKFLEDDALEGKDPYSASKVATESVLRAWQNISSLEGGPTVLSLRAGNVIGGGDLAPNRIFPDIVRNLFFGENLEIRNLGSTRPWQHVIDPLNGYITAANNALSTRKHQNFNFGPVDASLPVSELLDIVKKHRGKDFENIRISNAISKHESELLDLNSEKANQVLGWQPVFSQKEAILSTIKWWENVENHELSPLEACERDLEYLVRGSTKK